MPKLSNKKFISGVLQDKIYQTFARVKSQTEIKTNFDFFRFIVLILLFSTDKYISSLEISGYL